MAVERLKIRCYQCNQLLAVSPNKAGTVVACPKCKADLLIPRQETPSRGDGDADDLGLETSPSSPVQVSSSASGSLSSFGEPSPFLSEIAAVIPPEVAALRPEDLRVEAEFFESLTNRIPETSTARSEPFHFPASFAPETLPPPMESPAPSEPGFLGGIAPAPVTVTSGPIAAPPPLPVAPVDVVVPPIRLEPSPILPQATEGAGSARSRCQQRSCSPGHSSSSPPSRCRSSRD